MESSIPPSWRTVTTPRYLPAMSANPSCPFCNVAAGAMVQASDFTLALRDAYPVAPGHTLVVPRRHVASIFELEPEEWDDLWALVRVVRHRADELAGADGVNVGVNDGAAAGQTVAHAHVHLIPRRRGDVPDPRGGVRWVLPRTADYWSPGSGRGAPGHGRGA